MDAAVASDRQRPDLQTANDLSGATLQAWDCASDQCEPFQALRPNSPECA
jgi:hypothetical protein